MKVRECIIKAYDRAVSTISARKKLTEKTSLALILLPIALAAIFVFRYGVNFPYWDQWQFVPVIEHYYNGTLTFEELFSQHNEHRLFFPRLVMLGIAIVTGYNNVAEMYVSLIIASVTLLLIYQLYAKNLKFKEEHVKLLLFVPVAWAFFTLAQYENLLWGWQIQIFLAVLGLIGSIYYLERSQGLDVYLAGAIAMGVVSTFSFINGLLVWPIGLFFIFATKIKKRLSLLVVWLVTGVSVWSIFFYGWVHPSYHPSLFYSFGHLGESTAYLLTILGAPICQVNSITLVMGLIMLLLVIVFSLVTIKKQSWKYDGIWLSLILFSVLSAAACMIGRSGFGAGQALSSRYTTFELLGVIGLYVLAIKLLSKERKPLNWAIGIITVLLIMTCVLSGFIVGATEGQIIKDARESSLSLVLGTSSVENMPDELLKQIFPAIDLVKNDLLTFQKYHLNAYRYTLYNFLFNNFAVIPCIF